MSTNTLTPPKPDTAKGPGASLRGSVRVLLRVHRRPLRTVVAAVLLWILGMAGIEWWSHRIAEEYAASGCSVEHTVTGCGDTVRDYLDSRLRLKGVQSGTWLLTMALPAAFGAFIAGPALARELESGTFRLAWSQSVPPSRWLAAKLLVPAVLAVATTSALATASWWFWSRHGDSPYPSAWFERSVYGAVGTVPVAHALFGLALGALAGLLVRRTVAAMAATAIGYGLVLLAVDTVRAGLWPTRTDVFPVRGDHAFPPRAWSVAEGYATSAGERIPVDACLLSQDDLGDCLASLGASERYHDYHPASHFWPLQLVETGILLALAALAVFAAFRVLRRLHG